MLKRTLLIGLVATSLIAPTAVAQEYMFTYSKLYGQLKQNAKEGHDDVKLGLFFIDSKTQQICQIKRAWMEKDEHYEEFTIPDSQELPIPVDANLRSANPLVYVQLPEGQECSYSFVVMSKSQWQGSVNYQTAADLVPQMQNMLNDLSGMFSRWFTPDIQGVTLEFASTDSQTTNGDGANYQSVSLTFADGTSKAIVDGKAQVTLAELKQLGELTLPMQTQRILPYIPVTL